MQKAKINDPSCHFDIEQRTVMLEGNTDNIDASNLINTVISKTFPGLIIENKIKYRPQELNIVGVNISGVKYIKLDDGTKIFKGGPLENGCIIENIKTNNVYLNCRGTKVMYELGDKT